ncbi:copper resistance protein [Vibrio parahaemolyticus]|nr:copper resistance protein [Vibrio parahaemolyticus]
MNLSPSCDLSEKLVQAYQHQFDHILIPFFLFALIVALPMASTAIRYLEYTETDTGKVSGSPKTLRV